MSASAATARRPRAGIGRHVLSILALPFMNTVVIPSFILGIAGEGWIAAALPDFAVLPWAGLAIGAAVLILGLLLVVTSIALFASKGRGTLAPWDPPQRLVVSGPYRYVRNPMKAGLIFVLAAEALLLDSPALALWCAVFATINAVYIRVSEEPGLRRRFGRPYIDYCEAVPAWLPLVNPWWPPSSDTAFSSPGTSAERTPSEPVSGCGS